MRTKVFQALVGTGVTFELPVLLPSGDIGLVTGSHREADGAKLMLIRGIEDRGLKWTTQSSLRFVSKQWVQHNAREASLM